MTRRLTTTAVRPQTTKTATRPAKPSKTSTKPAHRGPGRPTGSKSDPPAIVDQVPAACPYCKHTQYHVIRINATRKIGGNAPNGQPRTHIVWRRVQCDACRRYFTAAEHQFRPAE